MASFPPAIWHPSPNFRPGRRDIVNLVVLHTTECGGPTPGACSLETLTDPVGGPGGRVSAHYLVIEDGTVYQLVAEQDEAWTQGTYNPQAIGIEVAGRADSPQTWTPAVVQSLGDLVGYLATEYSLPLSYRATAADPVLPRGFVAHAALDPSRRSDPGPWFPWEEVQSRAHRAAPGAWVPEPDARRPGAVSTTSNNAQQGTLWLVAVAIVAAVVLGIRS